EQVARDDEAADVLREMPREAGEGGELLCERQEAAQPFAVGIEARLAQPLAHRGAAVPPLHHLRAAPALLGAQAEGLAQVAQGAPRAVADDGRRERGPLAPVLGVDVLQYLLAPLVLEVDVDVGGLVALARDEALEQQRRAALGVDRGDAEAVTD